jgi:hypothetical protein
MGKLPFSFELLLTHIVGHTRLDKISHLLQRKVIHLHREPGFFSLLVERSGTTSADL